MSVRRWLCVAALIIVNGCASFQGVEPIYPTVGHPEADFTTVENLQPTLEWTAAKEEGVTYDLIIYEGITTLSFWKGRQRAVGEKVYYREGVSTTNHKVEKALKPGTEHYWSVRTRKGDKVSDWSMWDFKFFAGVAYYEATSHLFTFRTPGKAPPAETVTCSTIGSSQLTSPGNRIDLSHFSVQLPDDAERWCSGGLGTGHVVLYTHPLMGQYVEKPERQMALNTVALMAMELDHGSTQFETTKALQSFVEDWIDRGFGVEGKGSDIKVMHTRVPSFTVRWFNVTPDPNPQAHCVRYEYQMEERDNPAAPDNVLVLDVYGLVCQHPRILSNIVSMGLSERYPEGDQIDPGLYTQLKRAVALPFFDSLQF